MSAERPKGRPRLSIEEPPMGLASALSPPRLSQQQQQQQQQQSSVVRTQTTAPSPHNGLVSAAPTREQSRAAQGIIMTTPERHHVSRPLLDESMDRQPVYSPPPRPRLDLQMDPEVIRNPPVSPLVQAPPYTPPLSASAPLATLPTPLSDPMATTATTTTDAAIATAESPPRPTNWLSLSQLTLETAFNNVVEGGSRFLSHSAAALDRAGASAHKNVIAPLKKRFTPYSGLQLKEESPEEATKIFSSLFKRLYSDLPLSTMQVITGLLVVQRLQERRMIMARNKAKEEKEIAGRAPRMVRDDGDSDVTAASSSAVLTWDPMDHNEDEGHGKPKEMPYETVTELYHWLKFSCAAYGWVLLEGWRGKINPFQMMGRSTDPILANERALMHHTGIKRRDLIMAKWESTIYRPANYIAIDHKTKSICVVIRGSRHLKDAYTDVVATSEPLTIDTTGITPVYNPDGSEQRRSVTGRAHTGMLRSAEWFAEVYPATLKALEREHPGYGIKLLGHSLGAGVASLTALLLRRQFPELRCFAFAPPAVVSIEIAQCSVAKRIITSVVLGDDVVPRLSIGTMEDLRAIIVALADKNIYRQYYHLLTSAHPTAAAEEQVARDNPTDGPGQSDEGTGIHDPLYLEPQLRHPKLYPPGRILHLAQVDPTEDAADGSSHAPPFKIVERDQEFFGEILLHQNFMSSHLPNAYEDAFEAIIHHAQDPAGGAEAEAYTGE